MDTSFWTQFNPDIAVVYATKKFYNQYLYKLVVHAPGGRGIFTDDIEQEIENRKVWDREINRFGWWGRNNKNLESADIEFLKTIQYIKNNTANIKIRVEEPNIQIYAETNIDLQNVVGQNETAFKKYTTTVVGPENANCETILNSGSIIKYKESKYRYKITIRDGKYPVEVKQNILNYLDNLPNDQLRLTAAARRALENVQHNFVWGCYFYTNDPGVATFLTIMAPTLISNIHELVPAPAK